MKTENRLRQETLLIVKQTHDTSYDDTPHTDIHMGSTRFPLKETMMITNRNHNIPGGPENTPNPYIYIYIHVSKHICVRYQISYIASFSCLYICIVSIIYTQCNQVAYV